jgi:hypothetical protein
MGRLTSCLGKDATREFLSGCCGDVNESDSVLSLGSTTSDVSRVLGRARFEHHRVFNEDIRIAS